MSDKSKSPKVQKSKVSSKELEAQVYALTEALQRERADADNIRRRHEDQIGGLKDMVKASVVRELLPVIDNFERALKHSPLSSSGEQGETRGSKIPNQVGNDNVADFVKGILAIIKQFEKTLSDMGVERIKTVGHEFDPHLHEAISMDEDGDGQVEIVCEELQPGYRLGDEVIRHAMVKVKMGHLPKASNKNSEEQ